ncbi:MAG: SGNH/GDSL hydrolase family protein, partial [Actinomycetota bacterium]
MLRLLRLATALLVGAVAVVGLVAVGPAGAAPGAFEPADEIATAPATSPSRYEALGPCRIIDQRTGLGIHDADGHHIVTILDRTPCDIPDGATSILTTITITGPASDGFTVGYATGASVPEVAQLNHRRGETRANGALIPLSTNRSISFFRLDGVSSGSLVVDVVGAFIPSGPTSSGRLVAPDTATRLLDTRSGASAPPADRATLRVPLPDHVPADATALVVTAVVAGSTAPGFLTLSPAGSPRPTASTLNVDGPGQFRSGTTIVPVTADGFDVYVHSAAHVVIDTTGWVTGPSAEASTDGLFVAAPPTRLRDTRNEPSPINPGGTIEIGVPTPPGASAAAVLTSITMMQGDRPSFIAAHAARSPRGGVSSGNTLGGEFVAQASVTAMSPHGIAVFSLGRVDVTVDLFGWFLGPPAAPTEPPASNPMPRQRVLTIGDSVQAGIERNAAFDALRGARFEVRAESC